MATHSPFPFRLRVWISVGLICLTAWIAYLPSFSGEFFFDDEGSIVSNPHIQKLWPLGPILIPPGWIATLAGRPLLSLSLALNWAWGKGDVFGYHVVNFCIHAAAGILLFLISFRLLLLPATSTFFRQAAWSLATTIALLWTLHPLQTESVTYIVQRAECMAGMFYFFSLYAFLRVADLQEQKRRLWMILSILACLLAIGTKESGATIPIAILLLDRAFLSPSWMACLQREKGRFYFGLSICWVALGTLMFLSAQRGDTAGFGLDMSSWDYAISQFGIITHYFRLTFWPNPLVLDYGVWLAKSPMEIWPPAILISLLVISTFWLWRRDPRWGFLGLFFWLTLGPTSSVVPLVTQTAAEHRMYLPLAGLIPIIVLGFYRLSGILIERLRQWRWDVGPVYGLRYLIVAGSIGGCFYLTYQRNLDYQDQVTMWQSCVNAWPTNARTHTGLASSLFKLQRYPEALSACDAAIKLDPGFPGIHYLKGNIYRAMGQTDKMFESYNNEIQSQPMHPWAFHARGVAKLSLGDFRSAYEDFSSAVKIRPDLVEFQYLKAKTAHKLNLGEEALTGYCEILKREQAIRLEPRLGPAYELRAECYAELGELEQSRRDASTCTRLGIKLKPELLKKLML